MKSLSKVFAIVVLFAAIVSSANAQTDGGVGIGTRTPNSSSILDVYAMNKGVLLPRIALTDRADVTTINPPVKSMIVYNTKVGDPLFPEGYYYWNGTHWTRLIVDGDVTSGLQVINGKVMLGGKLETATTITTDAAKTLKIDGLQSTGVVGDNVILGDATGGFLKQQSFSSLLASGTSVSNTVGTGTVSTTVNGVTGTAVAIPNTLTSATNTLSSSVAGGTAQTASIINSHTLSSAVNTLTSVVNGVSATADAVNSVTNTVAGGAVSTAVNGVAGTAVAIPNTLTSATNTLSSSVAGGTAQTASIINTNVLTNANGSLVSTVNGVSATGVPVLISANNGLTTTDGNVTLGGALTIPTIITADETNIFKITNASTSTLPATGLVQFSFAGAHAGTGVGIDDVTATGTGVSIAANSLTTGLALSISSASTGLTSGSLLALSGNVTASTDRGLLSVVNNAGSSVGTVATIKANTTAGAGLTVLANGNVGVGIATPVANLHNAGSTVLGMTAASNTVATYTPDATATVDIYSGIVLTQSTTSSTFELPVPTDKTSGRIFNVVNATASGVYTIKVDGNVILAGKAVSFIWNGLAWSSAAAGAISGIVTKGEDYSATATDETILVNAVATITLPDATTCSGKKFTVKNITTNGAVVKVISSGTTTIDGNASSTGVSGSLPYQGWTFQSDGANWYIISRI